MPLDCNVGCHACRMQIAGAKDGHITVVSRNNVIIVAMSQLQLQCHSHNRSVAVMVEVTRSQGMRRRKNGVSCKLHRHTGK